MWHHNSSASPQLSPIQSNPIPLWSHPIISQIWIQIHIQCFSPHSHLFFFFFYNNNNNNMYMLVTLISIYSIHLNIFFTCDKGWLVVVWSPRKGHYFLFYKSQHKVCTPNSHRYLSELALSVRHFGQLKNFPETESLPLLLQPKPNWLITMTEIPFCFQQQTQLF